MSSIGQQVKSQEETHSTEEGQQPDNFPKATDEQKSEGQNVAAMAGIVYPDPNNPYKCISNGVPMTWNEVSRQWIPDVEVDEDFLAIYNANYGLQYDYSKMQKPTSSVDGNLLSELHESSAQQTAGTSKEKKLTKEEKQARKREAAKRQEGWVELDEERNTSVYVSGFPPSITEEQFIEFMSKCGVIMKDPRTLKPKIKLYKTESGEPKGDGTCCYIKIESVELALQILDGWAWENTHKIHVEKAKFELKGDFDPSKKRRRLTGAQKKRFFERQQKIFEWKPDKPRNYRANCEYTLVLRGMFTLEEIDTNAERIFTLKEDTQKLCERFGPVKKVVVYDTNPDGVVTVTFESVEHTDTAVQALNGRIVAGRVIQAHNWDGREKFKRAETAEERARRENAWTEFLGHEEEEEKEDKKPKTEEKDGKSEVGGQGEKRGSDLNEEDEREEESDENDLGEDEH